MSDNRARLMRSCVLVLIIVSLVGFTGADESARAQVAGEGEDQAAREAAAPLIPAMAEAPQPQPAELPVVKAISAWRAFSSRAASERARSVCSRPATPASIGPVVASSQR